jgi:hypothetical protein
MQENNFLNKNWKFWNLTYENWQRKSIIPKLLKIAKPKNQIFSLEEI